VSTIASEKASEKKSNFFFIGNHPALDLANTLVAAKDGPLDLLPDFSSLCRWMGEAKLMSADDATAIAKKWTVDRGERFLTEVKSYRAGIKGLVAELGNKEQVPTSFIEETNRLMRSAKAVLQIKPLGAKAYARSWPLDWEKPDSVLGLIAETGLHLLCDCDLSLVRKCENPQCVLTFYDTTKNHLRRWCSMEICGNRHKATLHRRKIQGTSLPKTPKAA
jgi:predicted RNA-binding Zn ribbon-like protein